MAGEEAGSKIVRLVSFLGAGVICTAAINMWRDLERKSALKTMQASEKASNVQEGLVHILRRNRGQGVYDSI